MIWSTLIGDYELNIIKIVFGIYIMIKSRELRGKSLIEYKKSLQLTSLQREVLVGTLLGNATLPPTSYIKFEQNLSKAEYIYHLYNIFEPFVGTPPRIRNIPGGNARPRQSIWFRTYQHPAFRFYNNLFYIYENPNRKKRVPKNIPKLLTPRGLAYWFMNDGTFSRKSVKTRDYFFSTQSFTLSDQKKLQKVLYEQFNIKTNIHKDKNYYRLYILKNSSNQLIQLIQQYIQPCFFL
uniref:Homing endonuclease LAGLIDADG domain-containing protein n=1 Tax=Pseudochlorodesmis sp. HV01306a TaxID=2358488 RepID=A0A386AXX9_9CHLO|nr:hypothetical protein [Pseudochlorodesmis sp. HV01306a]